MISSLHCENAISLENAIVGIYGVDMNTGQVLVEKNSDLSLIPSSCLKIVTTAAALHLLGPETRFETHLKYDGFIDDHTKTLHGNIYICGHGDPCLGSGRVPGSLSWKKQLNVWVEAIQRLGIQKITGKIIGDATIWEKALAVPSWSWEDIGNYYGAGGCALSFNENQYSLFFKPGVKEGDPALILRTEPPLPSMVFHNTVRTGPPGSGDLACIYGTEYSCSATVRGTVPAGVEEFAIKGSIPTPAVLCAELLTQALQEKGLAIQQQKSIHQSEKQLIHTTVSPTVAEIVYWANQLSINLYAENLLKKIGEVVHEEGSTQAGLQAIKHWLSQQLNVKGLNIVDGSGLSRKNVITSKQLVEVLLTMKKSPLFPIFLDSLPQYNASIRAKSGTMSLIKGYVGYKDHIAFAILVNHHLDSKKTNEIIDQFLSTLGLPNVVRIN
jgi:D-alanyl-D-alanine carboxypeptidase/D-alanyl-D-alanine-endopeptidase (penicillin-binding protein 4)